MLTFYTEVVLRSGLQVNLRVAPQVGYGAAPHYFTGAKALNIAIGNLAQKKGMKINECGVFKNDLRIVGKTEENIVKKVDLPYIELELWEDRGEIQATLINRLPGFIRPDNLFIIIC